MSADMHMLAVCVVRNHYYSDIWIKPFTVGTLLFDNKLTDSPVIKGRIVVSVAKYADCTILSSY